LQELEKKAEELAKKEQDMKNMQFQGMCYKVYVYYIPSNEVKKRV